MNVLFEAIGSPGWPTLLPWLRSSFRTIVALEIDPFVTQTGLADRCLEVVPYRELQSSDFLVDLCMQEEIDLVFPSVDEGLLTWDAQREALAAKNIDLVLSPRETLEICLDKWLTYQFFQAHGIPTPKTSLSHEHELVKPRQGRGGNGVRRAEPGSLQTFEDSISQEIAGGQEISIDILCKRGGELLYAVQRERLETASGISVRGRVVFHSEIDRHVRTIVHATQFTGIANLQCFIDGDDVKFIEINPRIPGGLSLSLAATENWFDCWLKLRAAQPIEPVTVQQGLAVSRHYADAFIPPPISSSQESSTACPKDAACSSLPASVPSTTFSTR